MPVIKEVRLEILSREEINNLQNEVIQIEKLADRKAAAESRITQKKGRGGIFEPNQLDEALPRSVTKRQEKGLIDRVADSKEANTFKQKDTTSAAPFEKSNPWKDLKKEVLDLKKGQQKTQDALSFITDFQGTAATKLLGFANRILPIGFALSIATTVYGMIVQQFGKGGIFDIRKKELDSTRSLIGLERETAIIGGEFLFLGNPILRQGVPINITSNTADLRDGQRRFVLRSNGY